MSRNTTSLFSILSGVPGLILTRAFQCGFSPHEFFLGTPASSHSAKTCHLGEIKTQTVRT